MWLSAQGSPASVKGEEAEEHAQPHQRERGREAHHDHDHDEAEHHQAECGIAHRCRSPPMPRWRALSSMSCACSIASLARFLVDILAVRELLLDDVDLLTSLSRRGQAPVLQADDAAHDLGEALQQHQRAGQRDHRT